jgi:hypothetical protein
MGAEKYIKPGVELLDPEATAVEPTMRSTTDEDGMPLPYSATAFREALADPDNNRAVIEDFVGKENVKDVLKTLGLSGDIKELSAAGVAGGMQGAPGKKKKIVRRENIDLHTVDEVMRLIMERGILK